MGAARARATKFDLPFELTLDWILERLDQPCFVTGLPFVLAPKFPHTPSLDQRVPGAGYTLENTQVVVWIYNAAKQGFDHQDVLVLARALAKSP